MTNWIKCEERLPGKAISVLGINKQGHHVIAYYDGSDFVIIPGYWINTITHWQPLPEAPNEN